METHLAILLLSVPCLAWLAGTCIGSQLSPKALRFAQLSAVGLRTSHVFSNRGAGHDDRRGVSRPRNFFSV
jgi:hypothetical protein